MTDNLLTLFCLVDGDSVPFSVDIDASKTVDHLKNLLKTALTPQFDDLPAKDLTLWRVSIPLAPKKDRKDISLGDVPLKEELDETDDLSDVFPDKLPKKTIHIIVQRPPPGDLHADIKRITDKFFAPGPIVDFLDALDISAPKERVGGPTPPKVLWDITSNRNIRKPNDPLLAGEKTAREFI
ncbi:hypothetical protein BGX24_003978 [Mortierella sp. AD032]|nr:hypothetical protein BGX24_003978 [Mortierella sp. AD032]